MLTFEAWHVGACELLRYKVTLAIYAPLRSALNECHWHSVPINIRNLHIYCVNSYFLMFSGFQVQMSYLASKNDMLNFEPWRLQSA